jgi:Putative prokaryotic signal transducing protein
MPPVRIGSYPSRLEAEMAQGLLRSAGVSAWLVADDAGGAYPFQLSGGVQLMVDEADQERAEGVLGAE